MKYFVTHIKNQSFYMVGFALLFWLMGTMIPQLYFQYFDKTEYYQIISPSTLKEGFVDVEKDEYKACETLTFSFIRDSKVDARGDVTIELVLINTNSEVEHVEFPVAIQRRRELLSQDMKIPCAIRTDEYLVQGVVHYSYRGVEKATPFVSNSFKIRGL